MTEFDPIKAQADVVAGVTMARKAFANHVRRTEQKLGEAEAEHNAALLMESSASMLLEFEQQKLQALKDEAERRGRT